MNRESRKCLGNMFSLMERMNIHMTRDNAEIFTMLYENNSVGTNGGKFYPKIDVEFAIDVEAKKRQIVIKIGPLAPQTANKIKATSPYNRDKMGCRFTKDLNYVIISKEVPWQIRKKRKPKDNNETDTAQDTVKGNDDINDFMSVVKQNIQINEGNNNLLNLVNIVKGTNNGTDNNNNKSSNNVKNVSDVTVNGFASPDDYNAIVDNWLNNYYKGIVDIIASQPNIYDPQAINELYDINMIKTYIVSKSTDPMQTKLYIKQSDEEVVKEISDAIKNGNYQQYFSQNITPLNLEGAVWGNVLSPSNVKRITNYAKQVYGLDSTDPDFPTMVMGAKPWLQNYNRVPILNARTYPMSANHNGSSQYGAQGSYETVNKYGLGYGEGHMLGIDIKDTVPIDPNDDWYETRLGLANNLTGELNQMVINALNKVKDQIPGDLAKQAVNISSDNGKAKIYNKALSAYAQEINLGMSIDEIPEDADDVTSVKIYAGNIDKIADALAPKYGFARGGIMYNRIKDSFCFAIAHYTIGEELFGKFAHIKVSDADWKIAAEMIKGNVNVISSFIKSYVFDIFSPLRDEVSKLFKETIQGIKAQKNTEDNAVAEDENSPINENYDIESLIDYLKEWTK